jgi:hypothetical protein
MCARIACDRCMSSRKRALVLQHTLVLEDHAKNQHMKHTVGTSEHGYSLVDYKNIHKE